MNPVHSLIAMLMATFSAAGAQPPATPPQSVPAAALSPATPDAPDATSSSAPATPTTPTSAASPRETVLFESAREEDDSGTVLWAESRGDLDEEAAQRAARPWTFFHEGLLLREEAWAGSLDGTRTSYGYRVTQARNLSPITPQLVYGLPEVDQALLDELATTPPEQPVPLVVTARNVPAWDIPLRPSLQAAAAHDLAAAEAAREQARTSRAGTIRDLLAPIETAIVDAGGEVIASGELDGWIALRMPAGAVGALIARRDIFRIGSLRGRPRAANPHLDTVRGQRYANAQPFHDAGYLGEQSNGARHGFGDITVGVIETGLLENEACFLYDGAGCSGASRLAGLYRCDDLDRDGNYCEAVSDLRDNDDNARHATFVASTILADYRQGQGDPYALGDPNWTAATGHSDTFKNQNTGIAPEATLVFFGQIADNDPEDGTTTSPALAGAYSDAGSLLVDITNSSWTWSTTSATNCSLRAIDPHELELENAFDDGVFNVVSAGNPNVPFCAGDVGTPCSSDSDCSAVGGTCDPNAAVCNNDRGTACQVDSDCSVVGGPCIAHTSACNIGSPADVPKAFAVNALHGGEVNCYSGVGSTQSNCYADPEYTANGGINAVSNGATCTGCATGIALATLNRFDGTTTPDGPFGSADAQFNGTSAAGPVVAGSAALVKDWLLAAGQTWINSPGRLHTVMLAMGDRIDRPWAGSRSTRGVGASPLYGMGRMKLRLFEGADMAPWSYNITTPSFTPSSSDFVHIPFSTPMPTGTDIAKCVLNQYEDMSGKSEISRLDLEMRLRDPVAGSCSSGGTLRYTWIDAGVEVKHMTARTSDDTTLAGRCVEVTVDKEFVTPSGVTASLFCYYAGKTDEQY